MFVAPLVFAAAVLCIPLWPVAIALIGVAWLVVRPLEAMASRAGSTRFRGWSARLATVWSHVLKPWNYFDPPKPQ
jgi:hypothetical protein